MILIEKHHVKAGSINYIGCDYLSYVNKNLYNACMYEIRQKYFAEQKNKKSLIGLAGVCGLDFKNYTNQNSFIIGKRHYLDKDNQPKITNQYSFDFIYLNELFINSQEYKTKLHQDYIHFQQQYYNQLQQKINYYENITKQQYWALRLNKISKSKSNKHNKSKSKNKVNKVKPKSFEAWKAYKINQLKKQLNVPIDINTKILKQTQRQVQQDYSNYFAAIKSFNMNPSSFLGQPQLPNYKQSGSEGRITVTVPKEAISYDGYKRIIGKNNVNNDKMIHKSKKHHQKFIKQANLGVTKIKNKDKNFISIANMNIIIESSISKEQIKEIKIVPLNNHQINGYNICIIYDNAINKETNQQKAINKNIVQDKIKKLIEDIQLLSSLINNNNDKNKSNIGDKTKDKNVNKLNRKQEELNKLIKDNDLIIASIDMGVDNLMTVTTTKPEIQPIMVNGRAVKAMNQFYNKVVSNEKSRLSKVGSLTSNKIKRITNKRNQQINDALHQASSKVIDWLLNNKISTLIIGKNIGWKQDINIGKKNNQNFVQIPHAKLIELIEYKCKQHNILVILQEESYTSKASFLDLDFIPNYSKNNNFKYSGKRIYRGIYKANNGKLINADLNGALNILRKVIGNEFFIHSNSIVDWAVNPVRV